MNAKLCDRCHILYTQMHKKMILKFLNKADDKFCELDLCPRCQESLMEWFLQIPNVPKPPVEPSVFPPPEGGFVFNDIS